MVTGMAKAEGEVGQRREGDGRRRGRDLIGAVLTVGLAHPGRPRLPSPEAASIPTATTTKATGPTSPSRTDPLASPSSREPLTLGESRNVALISTRR